MKIPIFLQNVYEVERKRFSLWSPAFLMIGIGWYFSLDDEPPIYAGAALLLPSILILRLSRTRSWRPYIWPFLLIALGFTAAQGRAHFVQTPLLTHELIMRHVEGIIDEIEPVEKRIKLVISHPIIEGVSPEQTPLRLRISFRNQEAALQVGDRVRMTATIYPLPQPNLPGSYDFARHFYFRSIGGNGYALHAPEIIQQGERSGFKDWLGNLRHAIGENMRAAMPGATGAVAAGMTVGENGPIPADAKALLRDSGLAHMLAIAGLHLGIVAGIVFFNTRLLLTLWPPLALRLSAKKIAACTGLLSAFIYLLLAGMPIPAERAFIMVALMFLSFMLDRRRISLRTLATAAWFLLLLFPESMYGASFQMSFAATLAIIAIFERYGHALHAHGNVVQKIWRHGLGILATSLIATLATAPFVLYNFNRFASFGLIANMVVIPLATFVIMPGIVLSLLLMPLGLQAIGYIPLRYGTDWMMKLAYWVTNLPFASLRFPSPTDNGLIACGFGLLLLCLLRSRARLLGIPVMLLGLSTIAFYQPPDMLISHDGRQIMARLPDGKYTLLKGTARSFTAQTWLRAQGQDNIVKLADSAINCNADNCRYEIGGKNIIILKMPWHEGIILECQEHSEALVTWQYLHPYNCPGPARLIDRGELETHGTHALYFNKSGLHVTRTIERPGKRLWSVARENDIGDDNN